MVEFQDDGSEMVVKLGINMWGPDYGDTWTKYKDAAIWSTTVTTAALIASIIAFVMYTRSESPEIYPEDEEQDEKDETAEAKEGETSVKSEVYENVAYTGSDGDNIETSAL